MRPKQRYFWLDEASISQSISQLINQLVNQTHFPDQSSDKSSEPLVALQKVGCFSQATDNAIMSGTRTAHAFTVENINITKLTKQ